VSAGPVQRVVLVGFMASGKSTVGALLARRLGWTHLDLDREIEREQRRSVAEVFAAEGERRFRELEVEITRRLLLSPHTVLSPGGGWITNASVLDLLPADTLTVWLQVSAERVMRRVREDATAPERPLLAGPDPEARVRRLLAERIPLYQRADLAIPTDARTADDVVDELETIVRARNGAFA
jgi:shikimate kinase